MNEQKNRNFAINENGSIVVHNYCAMALPQITVTLRSGQTTYRFNGSYDGNRSLPAKLLDRMVKDCPIRSNGLPCSDERSGWFGWSGLDFCTWDSWSGFTC